MGLMASNHAVAGAGLVSGTRYIKFKPALFPATYLKARISWEQGAPWPCPHASGWGRDGIGVISVTFCHWRMLLLRDSPSSPPKMGLWWLWTTRQLESTRESGQYKQVCWYALVWSYSALFIHRSWPGLQKWVSDMTHNFWMVYLINCFDTSHNGLVIKLAIEPGSSEFLSCARQYCFMIKGDN